MNGLYKQQQPSVQSVCSRIAVIMKFQVIVRPENGIVPQPNTLRFIAVCVWLFTVISAAHKYNGRLHTTGDHGPCKFIPNTGFLNCPCTMSRSPNAEQILRLHNLEHFQDNCTRGRGNELRCQIAREARVEAGGVTLKLQGIPGTVFCEISNNTSGGEGSSQRTQVDQLSIPPLVTSANPLSTETDGRRVQDTTTSARMEIVIPGEASHSVPEG
ncbi:uncharacterized protein [Hemitrygon akajei]|uniref:uncharacterized protein n=1 Tax=Hemitrygon akajei TaxID=2704970 RepID=UPI003BF9E3AE